MLSDEIRPSRAIEIAIAAEHDSKIMHELLHKKLKSRVLKYQYEALMAEEKRHEHLLSRLAASLEENEGQFSERPIRSHFGDRLPDEAALEAKPVTGLLEIIALNHDHLMATYADLASRVDDERTKALLEELSEVEFAHKSKVLTDLQLMKHHQDYT